MQVIDVELPQQIHDSERVGVRETWKHVLQHSNVFPSRTSETAARCGGAIPGHWTASTWGGLPGTSVEDHSWLKLDETVFCEAFERFEKPWISFVPRKCEWFEHTRDMEQQTKCVERPRLWGVESEGLGTMGKTTSSHIAG